ncbi:MAG TPA: RNA polymerase sigma factor [Holophagaceae bacterium]|nr:RNA polymerase sigma factor [Holophagaceae bacterium]
MGDRSLDAEGIHLLLHEEGRFLAFLRNRLGNPDLAQDILQAAYLKSLEKGSQVHSEDNIVAWFYTLLRHAIADHFRSGQRQTQNSEALELLQAPEDPDLRNSSEDCVRVAMRSLRPDDAQLIEWADLNGVEVSEISARMATSPQIISQRLFRARHALRARLQELCQSCTATKCLYCKCPGNEMP